MLKKIKAFLAMSALFILSSCNDTNQLQSHNDTTPPFDIHSFFNGHIKVWGTIYNWLGNPTKTFTATMDCVWNKNKLTMNEEFKFSDNTKLSRVWHVTDNGDGNYIATADDVKGVAIGKMVGKGLSFKYEIIFNSSKKGMTLSANDYMLMFDDTVGTSTIKLKKLGIPVGDIIIFMMKHPAKVK